MKKKAKKVMRSDTEILKDLIDAVMEYNSLRDDEWDFQDEHGSPDFWGEDENDAHEELIGEILKKRREVRNLIVEATGDEDLCF
jgi:hypothetical protein